MITADEKRTTLLTLYPLFKEEVYRRRHEMMRWTAIGAGSLFTILLVLLLAPANRQPTPGGRALLCGGILLLTATFAALILQQDHRHRQAKRTLIDLERALGLFDRNPASNECPLYPAHWETDWQQDRSSALSIALLSLLAILTLSAVFLVS